MITAWLRRHGPPGRGFVIAGALLAVLGVLALLAVIVIGAAALWYRSQLPELDKVIDYRPRQHLQVFTRDGVEIAQFGAERRIFVPIANTPKLLRDAVLAVEDTGFYEHEGISWKGLVRAVWANATGGMTQGASTITQQVARTFFLSTRRTAERKIKEAMLARQIEARLSKDQILELYLNQIYLGQRSYGFAAAAQTYFGKTLEQLDVAETAMLAGLPQNPIHANPIADFERARARQRIVLGRMARVGVIDEATRQAAAAQKLVLRDGSRRLLAAEHVAEIARQQVVERVGERAYTEGIRVITSIVAEDQRIAHESLRRSLLAHERRQGWRGPEDFEPLPDDPAKSDRAAAAVLKEHKDDEDLRVAVVLDASPTEVTVQLASGEKAVARGEGLRLVRAALQPKAPQRLALRRGAVVRVVHVDAAGNTPGYWSIVQWPQAEGAFVALDPATGRVRALVGGFDFGRTQFNRATSAWRQPGSAFKPFLYSAAFENGVMPESRVEDLPLTNPDGSTPNWNPGNSDDSFDGEMSVREALVRSKNLVSIRLLQHVGVDTARAWIGRFGFPADKHPADLTLALGTGSVTPLQMAAAYAVFANGGHRVSPVLIERITDAKGQVLYEAPPAPALNDSTRVIPARNAFLVNSLLADVTLRGTAARAKAVLKRPDLYGKTGTTNDAVDAWFAGFHPGVVAVSWVGHDEPKSLGERESGGGLALPMWIDAMQQMLRGVKPAALVPPDGVTIKADDPRTDWRYAEYADGGFTAFVGSRSGAGTAAGSPGAVPASPASSPAAAGLPRGPGSPGAGGTSGPGPAPLPPDIPRVGHLPDPALR